MTSNAVEILRYIINGFCATSVHYSVLTINIGFFEFKSVGFANFVAAIVGISTSFLGSRYFVFRVTDESILRQAWKFSGLYGITAIFHALFLWVWSDLQGLDYRPVFLIATVIQVSFSYLGNKYLVFRT